LVFLLNADDDDSDLPSRHRYWSGAQKVDIMVREFKSGANTGYSVCPLFLDVLCGIMHFVHNFRKKHAQHAE
jgi:hypothetical protein